MGYKKIAVIGGGPAGLTASLFLANAGMSVTLFEKRSSLGGAVKHAIPDFLYACDSIDKDIELARSAGVEIVLGAEIYCLSELRAEGYDKIIFATGAWIPVEIELEKGIALNALDFLAHLKHSYNSSSQSTVSSAIFGESIAVIGAGNIAVAAALAAKRIKGIRNVALIYRRTKQLMPAEPEKVNRATAEGIELHELLSPKSFENGILTCYRTKLGKPDESGRGSPILTEETIKIPADTVIAATGNKSSVGYVDENAKDVYIIGAAADRNMTIAQAIEDAKKCVEAVLNLQ
jgi:putative selenate reductase